MAAMNYESNMWQLTKPHLLPAMKLKEFPVTKTLEDESLKEPTKCRYKPKVLVGNWFNERATYERPSNDWLTVYTIAYSCKVNPAIKKDKIALNDNKLRSERGVGSQFLIKDYGSENDNIFTTTNELFYEIIPSKYCGPKIKKYSGR